ncbi:MAG: metallophosphoesterase [bacterium]
MVGRLIAVMLVGLAGCAPVEAPRGVYGVRTLPAGEGWAVRWSGAAPGLVVEVDGEAVAAPAGGPVWVAADRARAVRVGEVVFTLPARPDPCAPLRFVVLGDGRAAVDGVGPSAYWAGILGEALALDPAFVVNTGDLVKNGDRPEEWPPYLASLPPWPPMVAVRGNHDRGPAFYELGFAPGEVFGFTWGPVFVAGLDTSAPDERLDALFAELEALLAASAARWRVVVLHRPVWSRGNHGSDERRVNDRLVPLLDRQEVDVVFAGHDHDYERFCVSRGVGVERRCVPPGEGTLYVVTGGAATFTNHVPGASKKVDPAVAAVDAAHSRVFSGAKHVVEVVIEGERMMLVARRTRTGNVRPPAVIDRVELPARRAGSCRR